ncbi:MAG: deoxyribodipyrimidine photo-lyase, partial [Pseudomonadota bacterium]
MTSDRPSLVWLRNDLRLTDNPAVAAAARRGAPIVLLYILDDETPGSWRLGGAARWWLDNSLAALEKDIARLGGELTLRRGRAEDVTAAVVKEIDAGAVYWCRRYEPFARAADERIKTALKTAGIETESFNGSLLFEPWE